VMRGFLAFFVWKGSEVRVLWQMDPLVRKEHSGAVLSVAFSPDGKRIVSGSEDKRVKIWDVEDGPEVRSFVGLR